MEKGQVWTPLGIHLWDISLCFWSDRSDLIADIRFNRIQCKWCRGAKFKFALGNWHRFANYWEEGPKLHPNRPTIGGRVAHAPSKREREAGCLLGCPMLYIDASGTPPKFSRPPGEVIIFGARGTENV